MQCSKYSTLKRRATNTQATHRFAIVLQPPPQKKQKTKTKTNKEERKKERKKEKEKEKKREKASQTVYLTHLCSKAADL